MLPVHHARGLEEYGEATFSRFACGSTLQKCEKGMQRRRGRRGLCGGLYGGIDDDTTACRCLVLLLLSQRQLPSASVFAHKNTKTRSFCTWWLEVRRRDAENWWSLVLWPSAKREHRWAQICRISDTRMEGFVACAIAFGETRRTKRNGDAEVLLGFLLMIALVLLLLAQFSVPLRLRVRRKQWTKVI